MAPNTVTQRQNEAASQGNSGRRAQAVKVLYRSFKASQGGTGTMVCDSMLEYRLGLYLEYHPRVASYARGDRAQDAQAPEIVYEFDGKSHRYRPDFGGFLVGGIPFLGEAGRLEEKSTPQSRAKATAATSAMGQAGGEYWIATEQELSKRRHDNLQLLHAHRGVRRIDAALLALVRDALDSGVSTRVRDLAARFSGEYPRAAIVSTAWRVVAEAAAAGRLLTNLGARKLTERSVLQLAAADAGPLLPEPLPSELPPTVAPAAEQDGWRGSLYPSVNPLFIPEEKRERYERNLAAVLAVQAGEYVDDVAPRFGISTSTLKYLLNRAENPAYGYLALIPNRTYWRKSPTHPEMWAAIRKLYIGKDRPGATKISKSETLRSLVETLRNADEENARMPSISSIRRVLKALDSDPDVQMRRSGEENPTRRVSERTYHHQADYAAQIVQVDEHPLDVVVVDHRGRYIPERVYLGVMICVKTAAILAAVVRLGPLCEEDYLLLVKQAIEPKDALLARYGCQKDWPCQAIPTIIAHDMGKIFTSNHVRSVLAGQFGIALYQVPAYSPKMKGTVEAFFSKLTREFEHLQPNTILNNPTARGTLDPKTVAEKSGLTLAAVEGGVFRYIVDQYLHGWDKARERARIDLWREAVEECMPVQWHGSEDDLKLLFMRRANRKQKGGYYTLQNDILSVFWMRYKSPEVFSRFPNGTQFDVTYDRRDVSMIYLYHDGIYCGVAHSEQLNGRPTSLEEVEARRKADAVEKAAADAEALEMHFVNRKLMHKDIPNQPPPLIEQHNLDRDFHTTAAKVSGEKHREASDDPPDTEPISPVRELPRPNTSVGAVRPLVVRASYRREA